MDYSADCPDDVLIEIFKNLDLKSRLSVSQVSQRWHRLLKDPRAFMEDVSISQIEEESDVKILTSTLIHIGKAKELSLDGSDSTTSSVSRLVRNGQLKVDQLFLTCSNNLSESECVNQLLPSKIDTDGKLSPSSITELHLSSEENHRQILRSDWSRFSKLEYLKLTNILIDTTSKPPPKLKRLDLRLTCDDCGVEESDGEVTYAIFVFNTTLTYLSTTLEELRVNELFNIEDANFEKFFGAIKNRLPKLRRLCFDNCNFQIPEIGTTTLKETMRNLILDEIKFVACSGNLIEYLRLFLSTCIFDIFKFETLVIDNHTLCGVISTKELMVGIYNLAVLVKKRKAKFGLNLYFEGDMSSILENFTVPIELSQTLAKLSLQGLSLLEFLQRHFDGHTYEKLTKIKLIRCKMNDDILKRIARLCPYLEKLHIDSCKKITKKGLKSFLIYWEERKSMRLSIECIKSILINGFLGTSYEGGRGILDEAWIWEENENGESSSKRAKITKEKYWVVFRKTFLINNQERNGTRLIIWDRNNSIGDGDQKMLVIKDYGKDKFIKKLDI